MEVLLNFISFLFDAHLAQEARLRLRLNVLQLWVLLVDLVGQELH